MSGLCRVARPATSPVLRLVIFCVAAAWTTTALGQFGQTSRFKLADSVTLDTPDGAAEAHLERVKQFEAVGQWDEAIEALLHVMNHYGDRVIELFDQPGLTGYTSVRDYCHGRLSRLPAEALGLYRQRVDGQAQRWYEDGVARSEGRLLENVVEQMFASRWGDDALATLGEMAIEAGDYSRARFYWQRILPADRSPEAPHDRVAYPDSDLDLAGVHARLVWVSILEGALGRAQAELDRFAQVYPGARGRFGGRDVVFADALASLLDAAESWHDRPSSSEWLTFGGNPSRNKVMPRTNDVGQPAWDPILLERLTGTPFSNTGLFSPVRVAEDRNALLSYHPLVSGNLLLVSDQEQIMAFDIHTGKPAWGASASIYPGGSDFRAGPAAIARHRPRGSLGAARFTMTVCGDRLYARVGNPITSQAGDQFTQRQSADLVCLDLAAQGRLVWKIPPEGDKWAFEGAPLSDGTNVYIAVRRSDVTPQAHVVCYDAATGKLRWRRFVCAAQTPGRGLVDETTHNLLTLARGVIYYNTNLGCVAALEADDGQVRWIARYARAAGGDLTQPASHFYRDLNPCVYHQGKVLAAPADSEHIFALDATTGRLLWATPPNVDDAVHLLGVAAGKLWASGDRLWWIDAESGKLLGVWPDQSSPKGFGRGVLAGDKVLWPTRRGIQVFDQQTGEREKEHDLRPQTRPGAAGGGNLVLADGYLLVATSDRLCGFVEFSRLKERAQGEVTARPDDAAAHFLLARCEEALDHWQAAARGYRRAIALADDQDMIQGRPLAELASGRLYDLLIERSRDHDAQGDAPRAEELLAEAVRAAPNVSAKLSTIFAYADLLESTGRAAEAAEQLQAVLLDDELASLNVVVDDTLSQRAAVRVAVRMEQLIVRNGSEVSESIEASARQMLGRSAARRLAAPCAAGATDEAAIARWPLVRRWERTLNTRPVMPVGVAGSCDLRLMLVEEQGWRLLELAAGRLGWSLPFGDRPIWAGIDERSLIVATQDAIWGLNREDGSMQFQRDSADFTDGVGAANSTLHDAACQDFVLTPHGLLVQQSSGRLTSLDAHTGQVNWTFQPTGGEAAGGVHYSGDYVVLQTRDRVEMFVVQADDGALLHEIQMTDPPPRRPPVFLDAERMVVVNDTQRVAMFDLRLGHQVWIRDCGGPLVGEADVLVQGGMLIVRSADGGLLRLDPMLGVPLWTSPPRTDGPRQASLGEMAAVDATAVYCAAGTRLFSHALADGALRWEQPLSRPDTRWRLTQHGNCLAAVSSETRDDGPLEVRFYDPLDGTLIERMPFDADPATARVLLDGEAGIVIGPNRLWYFD